MKPLLILLSLAFCIPGLGQAVEHKNDSVSIVRQPVSEQVDLGKQLELYRKQRQPGIILQVIGFTAVAAGAAIYINDPSPYTQEGATVLILSGAVCYGIGATIQLGAGQHLRVRVK